LVKLGIQHCGIVSFVCKTSGAKQRVIVGHPAKQDKKDSI